MAVLGLVYSACQVTVTRFRILLIVIFSASQFTLNGFKRFYRPFFCASVYIECM